MFNDYFLQSLKQNEEPVAIIHKHWTRLAPAVARALAAFIIPSFFLKYILASRTAFYVYLVYIAVLVLYVIYSWIVYYFDVFIITDQRVVDVQQTGIFRRTVIEAPVSRIQDVTYNISGFFATLFNYGRVTVRTASESEVAMDAISEPEEVHDIIIELQKLNQGDKKMSAEDLIELISSVKRGNVPKESKKDGRLEDDFEEDEDEPEDITDDEEDEE